MAQNLNYHTGVILHVEPTKEGYEVTQVNLLSPPQFKQAGRGNDRVDFDVNSGPTHVKGYVDLRKSQINVEVYVLSISIGFFTFGFDGTTIKIDLLALSGWVRFYVKHDNELRVENHLRAIFTGFDNDEKIVSW
ncbi:hypothetical protein F5884DRAFT_860930 [Xylogone sp. PMI_703]|nr:hypothetical protein F5884DRAFT_860930 [Xylogone sp. PMI_703]